jgi:hypothetical protein
VALCGETRELARWRTPNRPIRHRSVMILRMSSAVSLGVLPTLTPAASRASFLAPAVPDEPDTMAPRAPWSFLLAR